MLVRAADLKKLRDERCRKHSLIDIDFSRLECPQGSEISVFEF